MYNTKNSQQLVREVLALMSAEFWESGCQLMSTKAAVETGIHSEPTAAKNLHMLFLATLMQACVCWSS